MSARTPGRWTLRAAAEVDERLGDASELSVVSVAVDEVELETELDDGPDDDDETLPLWLVPALDRFQRITLRGAVECSAAAGPNRWLIDEWHAVDEEGALVLDVFPRVPGAPSLTVRGLEVVVHAPSSRLADLATDPDVVRLRYARAVAPAPGPEVSRHCYELRRGEQSPARFVERLRVLGELPGFLDASSGETTIDAGAWPDYVTPGRRPWR